MRALWVVWVGVFGVGCGAAIADGLSATNSDTSDTATVLARANDWSTRVRSGTLHFRTEANFLGNSRDNFIEEADLWFENLRSRLEQRIERLDASDEAPKSEEHWRIFDGEKVTDVSPPHFSRAIVTTPRDLSELPRYSGIGHAASIFVDLIGPAFNHGLPLGEKIASWGGQLSGEEEVAGLKCLHLETPSQKVPKDANIIRHWWLAPSKGYALAQQSEEITWPPPQRTAFRRNVDTVEQWMQTGDSLWVPKVVVRRVYIQLRDAEEALRRVDRIELVSAAFNTSMPDELFHFDPPETTHIIHRD